MIKKITNWTFGSVFRTIGRFIAYIIIGILISLLFIKKDYVKADTYNGVYVGSSSVRTGTNTQWYTLPISGDKYWLGTWTTNGSNRYIYKFGNSSAASTTLEDNVSYMLFNVKLEVYNQDTINLDHMQCYFAGSQMSSGYPIYSQLNCNVDGNEQNGTIEHYDVSLSVNYWYNNNVDLVTSCYIQSYANNVYTIMCPKITNNISGLQFNINTGKETTFNLGFNYLWTKVYDSSSVISGEINNQTQQQEQQHNETISTITGEVNGTGENGTITDEDASSNSCGIICKLKHLIKMLSIDNIKYLVIPTEEQMNDLFEQMQTKVTSKLGILGLPVTVYTRLMQIAMQYDDNQQNWCLTWDNVQVPNFEDYNIIQGGQWCFSDILQNQKINTFRTVCITIIGGLILLSFIQYLFNCLHRILDVPIQDNYEYFTVEDVTTMDPVTGEVRGRQHKVRRTQKLEVDE